MIVERRTNKKQVLKLLKMRPYIGKDLSRATDEIAFYEAAISLAQVPGASGFQALIAFAFEYAGVFTCKADLK